MTEQHWRQLVSLAPYLEKVKVSPVSNKPRARSLYFTNKSKILKPTRPKLLLNGNLKNRNSDHQLAFLFPKVGDDINLKKKKKALPSKCIYLRMPNQNRLTEICHSYTFFFFPSPSLLL